MVMEERRQETVLWLRIEGFRVRFGEIQVVMIVSRLVRRL